MTQTPGATPDGQTPAATPPTPPVAAAPATPPAPHPAPEGSGKVEIPLDEYKNLQRDAARYRSKKTPSANDRRDQRYTQPPANDDEDPKVAELTSRLGQTERENMQLKLNNKVRDLLESDEYKDLPDTAKRILKRNPMAIVDNRAKTLDDAVADIQDWLDEELTLVKPATVPTPTPETPPVPGTPPTPSKGSPEESTEGKTGPARSTTILKNLMKQKGAK